MHTPSGERLLCSVPPHPSPALHTLKVARSWADTVLGCCPSLAFARPKICRPGQRHCDDAGASIFKLVQVPVRDTGESL